MSGKWHVTPVTESKHNWPLQRGFDRYYGIIHGAADYFNPVTLTRDNERTEVGEDYYFTDAIGQNAADFIRQGTAAKKPFFLYAAFTAPHWPPHARPADIERYAGRYKDGWDALREQRRKKMIELGIIRADWPMSQRDPTVPAWAEAEDKEWQQSRMEVYAAMVDSLDQNVGRILEALRSTGQERNTLVLFLADNGGCAEEIGPNWRGLHIPDKTRDGKPVRRGNVRSLMPGPEETYQSYGVPWANASNTPFRLYKHWVHEGVIATPLIAQWPGHAKAGAITHEPGHLIDLMAMCVDVSRAKYPSDRRGQRVIPMEGISLRPALGGSKLRRQSPIFWEHEGNKAVREGHWKLVSRFPGEWELYDLEGDRTETADLAAKYPDRVKKLSAAWEDWARRANVAPWTEVQKALRTRVPIPPRAYHGRFWAAP
jgi:arylsulfatase A-like enzyme